MREIHMPKTWITKASPSLPERSRLLAWAQFLELTGVHPSKIGDLSEIGWISPVRTSGVFLFRERDVYRVRKFERLCRDFELNTTGASIIVDLLERIEKLEQDVRDLRRLI
jgi:chaperone modulatory protein CbpM